MPVVAHWPKNHINSPFHSFEVVPVSCSLDRRLNATIRTVVGLFVCVCVKDCSWSIPMVIIVVPWHLHNRYVQFDNGVSF